MSDNSSIPPINLISTDLYREYWIQKTVAEIKKHTYINPLYDTGFKIFMNDEEALVSFLNGAFRLEGENRIESVTVKSTDINLVFPTIQPQFRLDIRAKTSNGASINVEMQKARPKYFADRVLLQHSAFVLQSKYEWNEEHFGNVNAVLSEEEKAKREDHRYEIPPTSAIWICDFPVGKQEDYYGTWAVRNDKGLTFNDKMMYILYDLTKFTKTIDEVKTVEDRWLYLLKHAGTAESLPDFNDDVIAKAINRLLVNHASNKDLEKQAANMVMTEEELDFLASVRVKARSEGADARTREMAAGMLAEGDSVEKVMKISKLTEDEVLAIKANLGH